MKKTAENQMDEKSELLVIDKAVLRELWKYKLFKISLVSNAIMMVWSMVALLLVFFALEFHHVPFSYGIDKYGRIIQLTPLSKSNLRTEAIGKVYADMLEDIFTFDPVHYKSQLNEAGSLYFTKEGFQKFVLEMRKKDGFLSFVLENTAITTAMSRGVPTRMGEGELNGRYSWKMAASIAIDLKGAGTHGIKYYRIEGILSRQAESDYEHGIAIESLSIRPISEADL